MTKELWFAIFSSSVIAGIFTGVLSALITGWFMLRAKRNDYVHEYYRIVLSRRVEAYEEVEKFIVMLKTTVLDNDKRPYHLLFSKDEDAVGVYQQLFAVMSKAIWLSEDLFNTTRELNLLCFKQMRANGGLIEFGKKHYKQIAEIRTRLEKAHVRDMLTLYNVPHFLKSKNPSDSYDYIDSPS